MSTQKIYTALAAIMAESEAITKSNKNQQQGFRFRGIDDCYASLHPIFAKHGVVTIPIAVETNTDERTNKNGTQMRFTTSKVTYRMLADDGSFVDGQVVGEGMDSGDKSVSKSLAIAHKYFLLQSFLVPTEDVKDPDFESHEVAPKQPAARQQAPAKNDNKPTFGGPNHKKLFETLIEIGFTPDDFMNACKYEGVIPTSAKSFFSMSEETAGKFLKGDNAKAIIKESIEKFLKAEAGE